MKPGDLVRLGRSAGGNLYGELGLLLVIHNNPGDDALPDSWRWCEVLVNGEIETDLFVNDLMLVTSTEDEKNA